jgi:hypothetical protein
VSLGLPVVLLGKELAQNVGPESAICSILVGNLILWLVGLGIISSVSQTSNNAIQNINEYVGRIGGFLFALIMTLAFLSWFAFQIEVTITGVTTLLSPDTSWSSSGILCSGIILGLFTALLAIGGIQPIKWITTISFPLLILYNMYVTQIWDIFSKIGADFEFSYIGIFATVLIMLPGIINLPTFFRYSRSRADSYLALSIMAIGMTCFECASIAMPFSITGQFVLSESLQGYGEVFISSTLLFLIVTCICENLLNIYLASACYEIFIPRFRETKSHVMMGFLGLFIYILTRIFHSDAVLAAALASVIECYIAIAGIVLVICMLLRLIVQHRPRTFEKTINLTAWLTGCATVTIMGIQYPGDTTITLLYGISVVGLFFLMVFFIEETFWSIKKVLNKAA